VARSSPSGTFSLGGADAPQAPSAAVALRTVGGIDALIALQGIEDPVERRRRVVKNGRRALDALDELKLGLLAGTLDQSTMLRLKSVAADLHDMSGDDRLDQVLAEIDLRVAVELAKAGMS
jgi:hypothetical protein